VQPSPVVFESVTGKIDESEVDPATREQSLDGFLDYCLRLINQYLNRIELAYIGIFKEGSQLPGVTYWGTQLGKGLVQVAFGSNEEGAPVTHMSLRQISARCVAYRNPAVPSDFSPGTLQRGVSQS
jgi:hypothetical protein